MGRSITKMAKSANYYPVLLPMHSIKISIDFYGWDYALNTILPPFLKGAGEIFNIELYFGTASSHEPAYLRRFKKGRSKKE